MKIKKSSTFMFLYAITTRLYIDFIGRLMAAEILAIIQLPFVNISSVFKKNKALRIFTYWVLVLLIAQLVSDIYNNSSVNTSLKAISVLIFMMVSVVFFIAQLTKNTKSIVFYLFGMTVVAMFFPDYPYHSINHPQFFKVSIFPVLMPLVLATSYFLKKYHLTVYLFIFLTFIAFMFDSRSYGLILLISAVILYLYEINFRLNLKKTLLSIFIITSIFSSMYALYVNNVINGNISGPSTEQILKLDNPFNPIELLKYGRVGTFVGIKAAMDKPVMGHGYMPIDHNRYYIEIEENMLGITVDKSSASLIPVHSVIIGAWVYTGIIGLVAIISIYSYLIILFYKIFLSRSFDRYMPILIFLVVMMTWDILFSPYGHLRTSIPIIAALLLTLSQQKENSD